MFVLSSMQGMRPGGKRAAWNQNEFSDTAYEFAGVLRISMRAS